MTTYELYILARSEYYNLLQKELSESGIKLPKIQYNKDGETYIDVASYRALDSEDGVTTITVPSKRQITMTYTLSDRSQQLKCTIHRIGETPLYHDIRFVMSKRLIKAWCKLNGAMTSMANNKMSENEVLLPLTTLPNVSTPYQGLNEVLGSTDGIDNGLCRGEFVAVVGFKGDYKEEFLKDMHLGYGLYNPVTRIDSSRKPVVLQFLTKESMDTYTPRLREKYTHNVEDAGAEWNQLCRNGLETTSLHIPDCKSYTVYDLFDEIETFEKANYEVHQVVFEDLTHISNRDRDGNTMSIRYMVALVREFFLERKTLFITSFEIDDVLKDLRSKDPVYYLNRVSATGFYGRERRLSQEVDCEIMVGATHDKVIFLPGKHRGFHRKPLYATYDLSGNELLQYDMDGDDKSTIGTVPMYSNPIWDL